jgi:hypothetical protein
MVKTLELAISKAVTLPEAAQEQRSRELLLQIDTLAQLRSEVEAGIRELDSGLGEELAVESVLRRSHSEHARNDKRVVWSPKAREDLQAIGILHERRNLQSVFRPERYSVS